MVSTKIDFFNFDTDAIEDVMYVYHGTRTHPEKIRREGLVFPGATTLLKMVERSLKEAGLSYSVWHEHQQKLIMKGGFNTFDELEGEYRQKIWVTDNLSNAWGYAKRAPEIVSEAIHKEYIRLHYRRKNVLDEAQEVVASGIKWIGNPLVVVLDAKAVGAGHGCNQPIAPVIPKEAILEIKTEVV